MVAASILLSVESMIVVPGGGFYGLYSKKEIHSQILPSWIPAVLGFVTPFFFTAGNLMIRYLYDPKYGYSFTSE